MFEKPYDPKSVEEKIYSLWEKSGYFNPDKLPVNKIRNSKFEIRNYVVYMPLPNVTGTLHMGHALNNTIQDILVRYHRMKGFRTLWLPGTDHAGIATQYVVEKEIKKQGESRFTLGRERFVEKVWEWKRKYGDIILNQLKKLGCSADWSRTRFTMDEDYSRDVLMAFIHYYEKGLIYRGLRTVNWCPRCGTSLSELELEYEDEEAVLWFIRYPISGERNTFLMVATTRPETMLGDTAIAVNPKDDRYHTLIGGKAILPLVRRELPIIADDAVDAAFGTGAVKVTPAHDLTDFEIGTRHQLPLIQVIDEWGKMNEQAGVYAGMKAAEARKKIVEDLRAIGLLEKEEIYSHRVAKCYRCESVIEPLPSMQWFLKMDMLARKAEDAVKQKEVSITPKNFEKPYFAWLAHIRDWTISRQIWWGHRLPVWECKCQAGENSKFAFAPSPGQEEIRNSKSAHQEQKDKFIVALIKPKEKCSVCNSEYEQVPDVLDTWFSSALWPFAGLSESDRATYYPGTMLVTARDILNLWVARMIFSGLEFMGKVPFQKVYLNGTILTKEGKRMSKSLGTGVDPLHAIEAYGADATRFGIVWQANGQDIRWDETALTAGKKLCNKLWNAARFVTEKASPTSWDEELHSPKTNEDARLLAALARVKEETEQSIAGFEFSKALHELYNFFWHEFCDLYLETSKRQLADPALAENTSRILTSTLLTSLKLFHPFLPFVTEAIYQALPSKRREFLMIETL